MGRVGVAAVFCGGRKCKKKTYRRTFARLQVLFDPLQSLRDSFSEGEAFVLNLCAARPFYGVFTLLYGENKFGKARRNYLKSPDIGRLSAIYLNICIIWKINF